MALARRGRSGYAPRLRSRSAGRHLSSRPAVLPSTASRACLGDRFGWGNAATPIPAAPSTDCGAGHVLRLHLHRGGNVVRSGSGSGPVGNDDHGVPRCRVAPLHDRRLVLAHAPRFRSPRPADAVGVRHWSRVPWRPASPAVAIGSATDPLRSDYPEAVDAAAELRSFRAKAKTRATVSSLLRGAVIFVTILIYSTWFLIFPLILLASREEAPLSPLDLFFFILFALVAWAVYLQLIGIAAALLAMPLILSWRDPARILLLRPFNRADHPDRCGAGPEGGRRVRAHLLARRRGDQGPVVRGRSCAARPVGSDVVPARSAP